MVSQDKKFTRLMKCGHCQNSARLEVVATYSGVRDYTDEESGETWEAGSVYELSKCPACDNVTLRRYNWHSGYMDGSEIQYTNLYPMDDKALRGLPERIGKAYDAARKVRNIDANAYGVLLGRVLELVCQDRDAQGRTLDQKLKNLAERNEIPSKLVDVAAGIRKLRNIGAHASLGGLTSEELPVLDDLTRAILEYVYSAPYLAQEAEERFAKLRTDASEEDASDSDV